MGFQIIGEPSHPEPPWPTVYGTLLNPVRSVDFPVGPWDAWVVGMTAIKASVELTTSSSFSSPYSPDEDIKASIHEILNIIIKKNKLIGFKTGLD